MLQSNGFLLNHIHFKGHGTVPQKQKLFIEGL